MSFGKIKVGRIYRNRPYPYIPGYTNITLAIKDSKWGSLSPTKLGPFHVLEDLTINKYFPGGLLPGFYPYGSKQCCYVNLLENFFQGSKIYEDEVIMEFDKMVILPKFFIRRARHISGVMPYGKKNKNTLGSYFNGKIYNCFETRAIFFYYYINIIQSIPGIVGVLYELRHMLSTGNNLLFLEYDAPTDFQELTLEYVKDRFKDTTNPFSYVIILACYLLGITIEHILI